MPRTSSRRKFIQQSAVLTGAFLVPELLQQLIYTDEVMTVNGRIPASQLGFTLTHEHILVDFIGAAKVDTARYDAEEVFKTALPFLQAARLKGCNSFIDCTPAYLGRNVKLLKRLAEASGLNIISNTGYYGAAGEKYLPAHAYTESARELARRWTNEWKNGIDGTSIKPGFIKSGVDKYPLSKVQQKIVEAAAITHLATGLTIGIHTGNGDAALEELRIITAKGVAAHAWIWIHAQNEKNRDYHFRIAKAGGWVSFDGVNKDSVNDCIQFLQDMKNESLLHHVLLSHDSGWYNVGEPGGGHFSDYNTLFDKLIPALNENNFTKDEIKLLFTTNPSNAFTVSIRAK